MKRALLVFGLGATTVVGQNSLQPGDDGKYTISSSGIKAQVRHTELLTILIRVY